MTLPRRTTRRAAASDPQPFSLPAPNRGWGLRASGRRQCLFVWRLVVFVFLDALNFSSFILTTQAFRLHVLSPVSLVSYLCTSTQHLIEYS